MFKNAFCFQKPRETVLQQLVFSAQPYCDTDPEVFLHVTLSVSSQQTGYQMYKLMRLDLYLAYQKTCPSSSYLLMV